MSDAAINSIALVLIALVNMVGGSILAYFTYRGIQQNKATGEAVAGVADRVVEVAETVTAVKAQTDGLTSALVKKTEEKANSDIDAARLAGIEEQRVVGEREAATFEAGRRAAGMETAVSQALPSSDKSGDVPVADARVGKAVDRMADATGAVADATEKLGGKI